MSFNDLSLTNTSGIAITNFGRSFSETDSGLGSCPDYLIETGRISMNHSPSLTQHCSYSVTVTVRSYMGEELPEGPIEEVTFENAEAACSINLSGLKVPRKLKMKPKKRFVIRRFQ